MSIFVEDVNEKEIKDTVKLKLVPEKEISKFNKQQQKAIQSDLPLVVVAGPGSGKTATITAKIAIQLVDSIETLKETLVLTFTNQASKEILERVEKSLGYNIDSKYFYTGTYHGIFYKLIRENAQSLGNFGFTKTPTIIEPDDDKKLFLTLVNLIYNEDGDKKVSEVKEEFLKIHNMKPADMYFLIKNEINDAPIDFKQIVSAIVMQSTAVTEFDKAKIRVLIKKFFELKIEDNQMSFDDILLYTSFMLEHDEVVREKIQKQFKYIVIDEYQDTNPIQSRIIDFIETRNSCKIGDPYQSIFKFLGAEPKNLIREINKTNVYVVQLLLNYRSSENIVNFTNDIVSIFENKIDILKPCSSANKEVQNLPIEVHEYIRQETLIIERIKEQIKNNIPLNEIAIMVRSKYESYSLEQLLMKENIKFRKVGGKIFSEIKEIEYLINLTKILIGKYTITNFTKFASLFDKVGDKTLEKVTKSYIDREDKTKTVKQILKEEFPKNKGLQRVSDALFLFDKFNVNKIRQVLSNEFLNFKEKIENMSSINTTEKSNEIDKNIEFYLKEVNKILKDDNILELEEWLSEITLDRDDRNARNKDDVERVTITTVHSSKGKEWHTCFILNAEDGMFPSQKSLSFDEQLEEERRLFYVAVSRAKELLIITSSKAINSFVRPFLKRNYIKKSESKGFNNLW